MPCKSASYLNTPESLEAMIELRGFIRAQTGEAYVEVDDFLRLLDSHIKLLKKPENTQTMMNTVSDVIPVDLPERNTNGE